MILIADQSRRSEIRHLKQFLDDRKVKVSLKSIKSAMSIGFRSNYDSRIQLPSIGSTLLNFDEGPAQTKSKRRRKKKRRSKKKAGNKA